MARLFTASALLLAQPPSEVEFNCPWCNTRLALSRNDFSTEKAVLCPRCSNPVDLDIQRRLANVAAAKPQRGAPPKAKAPPVKAPASKTTQLPSLHSTPTTRADAAIAPASQAAQVANPTAIATPPQPKMPSPDMLDWSKPLDIDGAFGLGVPAPKPPLTSTAPTTGSGATMASPYGGKLKCPSCGYENAQVPPEFSFGTVQKCAWCSKPLPTG